MVFLLASCLYISAQEIQVPFFPEAGINSIDKSFARKTKLFDEYPDFREARLFSLSENQYAVEIYYTQNDTLYKDRKMMSAEEKEVFIESMKEELVAAGKASFKKTSRMTADSAGTIRGETTVLNQQGRTGLLISSTLVSLSFYGYAVPLALNLDETKELVGSYMLVGSAGFLVPYFTTRNKNVSLSQLSMSFYGQTRGIAHGVILSHLLWDSPVFSPDPDPANDDQEFQEYLKKSDNFERFRWGMGVLGSLGEGIAGYHLARKWDFSTGSASILQMWGDVGILSGLLISDVGGYLETTNRNDENKLLSTLLLTSGAGLVTGKFFGNSGKYTVGDAIFYRSTMALGTFLPIVFVSYFDPGKTQPYTASMLIGGAAASYAGWSMLRNRNFTTTQGIMIALGELSGALLGLGTGYLISENSNSKLILSTTAIGAITGYGLFYFKYKNKAFQADNSNMKFNFNINPAGLFTKDKQLLPTYEACYNSSLVQVRLDF
mgnify:CR=1 FL=1